VRLEHSFTVDAPPETVWPLLLDIERVAPCLPGAESVERVDEGAYRVSVVVALGPMKLSYRGEVAIAEADDSEHRAVLEAKATEARGQGTARATITTTLAPEGAGTRAEVETNLQLTGRVAQMGRGIVVDVSNRLLSEFAECLARTLAASNDDHAGEQPPAAKPIGGLRLGLRVLWERLRRLRRRRS
jgi:carbon monoxide dehydrogenase subunit G